ncbi:hypothetical protein D3C73_1530860 [compost metagenome]
MKNAVRVLTEWAGLELINKARLRGFPTNKCAAVQVSTHAALAWFSAKTWDIIDCPEHIQIFVATLNR